MICDVELSKLAQSWMCDRGEWTESGTAKRAGCRGGNKNTRGYYRSYYPRHSYADNSRSLGPFYRGTSIKDKKNKNTEERSGSDNIII